VEQIKQKYKNGFHVYFQPIKGDSNEVLFRTSEYIATGFFHNSQILKVDHDSKKVTFRYKSGIQAIEHSFHAKPINCPDCKEEMEISVVHSGTAFREISKLRQTHEITGGYFRLKKPP
jgi:hypothetical protein